MPWLHATRTLVASKMMQPCGLKAHKAQNEVLVVLSSLPSKANIQRSNLEVCPRCQLFAQPHPQSA